MERSGSLGDNCKPLSYEGGWARSALSSMIAHRVTGVYCQN